MRLAKLQSLSPSFFAMLCAETVKISQYFTELFKRQKVARIFKTRCRPIRPRYINEQTDKRTDGRMGVGTGGAEGAAASPTFGTGEQAIALAPQKV